MWTFWGASPNNPKVRDLTGTYSDLKMAYDDLHELLADVQKVLSFHCRDVVRHSSGIEIPVAMLGFPVRNEWD